MIDHHEEDPKQALRHIAGAPVALQGGAIATAVAALGATALATSVTLPWLHTGYGTDPRAYDGTDVPVVAPVFVGLGVLALAATVCARLTGKEGVQDVASIAATSAAVIAFALIAALEVAAAALPDELLPATIRRVSVELSAGVGAWAALAGGLAAGCALVVHWRARAAAVLGAVPRPRRPVVVGAVLVLAVATAAVGFLRYEPWIGASIGSEEYQLEGWAVPYLGIGSLAAMSGAVAAVLATTVGRLQIAGVLAALAGWTLIVLAALALLTAGTIGDARVTDIVPAEVRPYAPEVAGTSTPWTVLAAGATVVAAGAALIVATWNDDRSERTR